jgi:hypothetical protein
MGGISLSKLNAGTSGLNKLFEYSCGAISVRDVRGMVTDLRDIERKRVVRELAGGGPVSIIFDDAGDTLAVIVRWVDFNPTKLSSDCWQ